MLALNHVSHSFRSSSTTVPVLRDVSLKIDAGETVALTGESGSGKSTLLHLMAGLDQPESGEISFEGTDITKLGDAERAKFRRNHIGLIFQQFNLVPSLTVFQNVALQARLAGRHQDEHTARLITRLGLDGLEARYPEQLSGGQQQRVAIGRTLANQPQIILADEPTGNLDESTADAVLTLMLDLVTETGAALVIATHSAQIAARFSRHMHLSMGALKAV